MSVFYTMTRTSLGLPEVTTTLFTFPRFRVLPLQLRLSLLRNQACLKIREQIMTKPVLARWTACILYYGFF